MRRVIRVGSPEQRAPEGIPAALVTRPRPCGGVCCLWQAVAAKAAAPLAPRAHIGYSLAMRLADIKRLQHKKHREETGLFLVEGETSVLEALAHLNRRDTGAAAAIAAEYLLATPEFMQRHGARAKGIPFATTSAEGLARAGALESNDAAILVLRKPEGRSAEEILNDAARAKAWLLALDAVNDPGNLGTIIRIADWFGAAGIIASIGTVDCYNAKSISASKGSFLRVPVAYADLSAFLGRARAYSCPVYAATLDGTSLHTVTSVRPGVLLLGSETHGINPTLLQAGDIGVTIPRFGAAESLNVAVATGIILDAFRRLETIERQ